MKRTGDLLITKILYIHLTANPLLNEIRYLNPIQTVYDYNTIYVVITARYRFIDISHEQFLSTFEVCTDLAVRRMSFRGNEIFH